MNQRIKKILIGIAGTVLFLLLTAVILAYIFEDKVKQQIIIQINRQITVPVQVKGSIDFSLLRHFPYASLSFNDVVIDDKLQKGQRLLKVKEFSLLCNVFSLFGNKIELSKIVISEGEINLFKDDRGHLNFDIIKTSPEKNDTTKSDLGVQLKRAQMKNVHFTYTDKLLSGKTDVQFKSVELKGNFSSVRFELQTSLKARVNDITFSGQQYMAQRNLQADIVLQVDNDTHRYTFKKGNLNIDDNEFNVSGYFASVKGGTQLDFKLENNGKDIKKLVGLIPEKYRRTFDSAEGSGQYSVTASVKGILTQGSGPKVNVSAALMDSEIKLGQYNKLLKKVNAKAVYELDEAGNDKVVISNFDCTLNNLPFNFKLSLAHLSDPDFDFYAQGVLNLNEISQFVPDSIMGNLGGTITFNQFHVKGRKRDFTDVANSTLTGSGEFKMNDIEFDVAGVSYGNINGVLSYHDQVIEARDLSANFLSNQAVFTGNIDHLAAFIYNLSVNRNAANVVLGINGKLNLKTFNLSGILDAYNKKNRPKVSNPKGKIDFREIVNMQGNLDVVMDKFIFRKMVFDQVSGNLQVTPGMIQCNNVQSKTMGGDIRLNGKVIIGDDRSLNLVYDVSALGLNLAAIFDECENFGQTVLTDKHLKGKLDAAVSFNAIWENYQTINQDKLTALVDFTIKDGELVRFEPIKAAAKFIRVSELEDIRFASISNTIKIGNGRIEIPDFQIESSALNLMFGGTHFLNNDIDYRLKINLHKLLAQKFNRKLDNIEYMESDPYEGLNLYLKMTGSLSNPQIKYDKISAKKKMKDDFKNERENMRNLLHNTAPKVDENEKKREEKYYKVDEKPKFMDFDTTSN